LDLVTLDQGVLVFVEVRSTGSHDPSRPAASVDAAKQRRLTEAAVAFLQEHRLLDRPARFDVLTIHWPPDKPEPDITHYRDAFDAAGRFQMYQ
jgi:putative endonuclease